MTLREFIKALHEADGLDEYSIDQINNMDIGFMLGTKQGVFATKSILSVYTSDNTEDNSTMIVVDIGEDP